MPATMPGKNPLARVVGRVVVGLAALVLVLVAGTGVASAHAALDSTTPADGQSVPTAPQIVSATFSESISADVGGLTIRNTDGDRVDDGNSSVSGNTLQVTVPTDLPDGTYIATYRVLSADGHPVSGSWLYGVGTAPVDPSARSGGGTGDGGWEVLGAIARFVTYLTALVAAGLAFFLAFLHDQRADRWKLVPVVRISAVFALFGVVGTIVAQAALLTGDGLSAATDTKVLQSVLTDRLGWASAVLLIGLAAVHLSTDTNRLLLAQVLSFYGGLAVTISFALWGHDTEAPYRWLSIGSDVVHVTAAAVWLGGLIGLTMVLLRRAPYPVRSTAGILGRFSTAAAVSVLLLVLAGGAMTWVETGSVEALFTTTYGRLVLVKMAITLGVVVMAAYNRFRLIPAITAGAALDPDEADEQVVTIPPRHEASAGAVAGADDQVTTATGTTLVVDDDRTPGEGDGGPPTDDLSDPAGTDHADDDADEEPTERELQSWRWIELRRMVGYEAVALIAVLGFTAVLVNTTPARTALVNEPKVVNLTDDTDTGTVNLVVTPAKVGTNSLHVQYADSTGKPVDVADTLTVEMSLPAKDLAPISRQVVKISPGHYVLEGDELSLAGEWTITLAVRTSDFSEERTSFQVPISK
jgi:copper transport protein